jgi:hypothetical protein
VKKTGKNRKKAKKAGKNEKIDLNFASLCFASKQKLLNRSKAKNLKRKKNEKNGKMQKNAKNSEKKGKKAKKSEKIDLNFASLCFTSKQKLLK